MLPLNNARFFTEVTKSSLPKESKIRRILGVDPGTNVLGYAFIICENQKISLDSVGIIRLDQYGDAYRKLQMIAVKLGALIERYQPVEMGVEAPFFGKNVQSMLKLGRAQGVAIATAMQQGLEVVEYSPRKIKQSVTGNGNASKEQVAAMVQRLAKLDRLPKYHDATDALAVAICHHLQGRPKKASGEKHYTDWKSFASENPKRVK